eukprot:1795165-Rhodomonas_salina.2
MICNACGTLAGSPVADDPTVSLQCSVGPQLRHMVDLPWAAYRSGSLPYLTAPYTRSAPDLA